MSSDETTSSYFNTSTAAAVPSVSVSAASGAPVGAAPMAQHSMPAIRQGQPFGQPFAQRSMPIVGQAQPFGQPFAQRSMHAMGPAQPTVHQPTQQPAQHLAQQPGQPPDASSSRKNRFLGICIRRERHALHHQFTLRNCINGLGVEVMYELYNPTILKIETIKLEKRLDTDLSYLQDAYPEFSIFDFNLEAVSHPSGSLVPHQKPR
ncbi:hypothetical protein M3Y95_00730400 [Aphelenchoides besseyi]|nr:hypothetical protein M3Y95_00730400 [Aphelenchoides besseyi]